MATLVCDLCGGKLIMGAGGKAICENCGMEHSAERMREKVQGVNGAVSVGNTGVNTVTNTQLINNYLEIAQNAREADNNAEAESYCNKVIEIDPTNYKAWILKGEAAAWQSDTQNSRINEGVKSFIKGIINAPEEERDALFLVVLSKINDLADAAITLRGERFSQCPNNAEHDGFISDLTVIINAFTSYINETKEYVIKPNEGGVPINEMLAVFAAMVNTYTMKAFTDVIWFEYAGNRKNKNDRADANEWQAFITRTDYCISLVEKALTVLHDDKAIPLYNSLIKYENATIDSCSWAPSYYDDYGNPKMWRKEYMLSVDAKAMRSYLIDKYKDEIKDIKAAKKAEEERVKREEIQKGIDAYWAEHVDEKVALEAERKNLNDQIASLNASMDEQIAVLEKEIDNIPGKEELDRIKERLGKLSEEKLALGLFKLKEKKAIQDKMDKTNDERNTVRDRMSAAKREINAKISAIEDEFDEKISPLQNRVDEIDDELTKPR